jgi:radical SAM protein with 4Fe4S-binding SPASM domain
LGVTWIDFTGGEVLIYKGWKDIVSFARSLGLVVSVHTNGLLLTERNVAFLNEIGVRSIQVTVESHHADIHEAVGRGSRESHARVIEGVRRARAAGLNVRLAALVHQKNLDHIRDSVLWFHQELQTPVSLDRVMATGVQGADGLNVSEAAFWEAVSPLLGVGAASVHRICDRMDDPGNATEIEPECGVAHSFVYLTADGHYSLCPTMTHREEDQFKGPTVREMSLEQAWRESKFFNAFRGLNCENVGVCPASSTCGGGCRSNAYLATGRLTAPDVISCNTFKNPNRTFVDFLGRYSRGVFEPVKLELAD